jgi:hypothetical protein
MLALSLLLSNVGQRVAFGLSLDYQQPDSSQDFEECLIKVPPYRGLTEHLKFSRSKSVSGVRDRKDQSET